MVLRILATDDDDDGDVDNIIVIIIIKSFPSRLAIIQLKQINENVRLHYSLYQKSKKAIISSCPTC